MAYEAYISEAVNGWLSMAAYKAHQTQLEEALSLCATDDDKFKLVVLLEDVEVAGALELSFTQETELTEDEANEASYRAWASTLDDELTERRRYAE